MTSKPQTEIVEQLVASHRELLAFVERRVGDHAVAEEILQDALVRSLDHLGEIRESSIGWFYGVLRNAIIDRARRTKVERARLDALSREVETMTADPELENTVCRCVKSLAQTLKPEYADALQRIDVEGTPVKAYAEQTGLTASTPGSACSARARRSASRSPAPAERARPTGASTAPAGQRTRSTEAGRQSWPK